MPETPRGYCLSGYALPGGRRRADRSTAPKKSVAGTTRRTTTQSRHAKPVSFAYFARGALAKHHASAIARRAVGVHLVAVRCQAIELTGWPRAIVAVGFGQRATEILDAVAQVIGETGWPKAIHRAGASVGITGLTAVEVKSSSLYRPAAPSPALRRPVTIKIRHRLRADDEFERR